jgi:ABC-type dipeptide/oligopeptide/nickel transport system ATPase component
LAQACAGGNHPAQHTRLELCSDEPTTALDVTIQAGILDLMRDIRDRLGTAIVLPYCAFAERCPRADRRSRSEVPQLREVRPSHLVACFHPGSE